MGYMTGGHEAIAKMLIKALKVGQIWSFLYFQNNPFKKNEKDFYEIIDVKNNYVQYQNIKDKTIDSMDSITFVNIFKLEANND